MTGPQPLVFRAGPSSRASATNAYDEVLRVPALSLGVFAAQTGHDDVQQPHREDEVYVVISGSAQLEIAGERSPVSAGTVAYVPAGVQHRFVDIRGDLRVVVVFAPPQT